MAKKKYPTRIPLYSCGLCKAEVKDYGVDSVVLPMDKKTVLTICMPCYFKHFNSLVVGLHKAYSLSVSKEAVQIPKKKTNGNK